jgi:hypothetical protein
MQVIVMELQRYFAIHGMWQFCLLLTTRELSLLLKIPEGMCVLLFHLLEKHTIIPSTSKTRSCDIKCKNL